MILLSLEARSDLRSRVGVTGEAGLVVEEPQLPALPHKDSGAHEDDAPACAAGLHSVGRDGPGQRPVGLVAAKAGTTGSCHP